MAETVASAEQIVELRDSLVRIETALAWQWQEQQKARRISNGARAAQNAKLYEQGENPADLDASGA